MNGIEHRAEHFSTAVEMVQVGAGEVLASVAVTIAFQRAGGMAMLGVANLDGAFGSEQVAIARIAGGHDAIEHVDTATYTLYQVLGLADAHQVAGLLLWHPVGQIVQYPEHFLFGLANREAADSQTVEADLQ